MGSVVLFGGCSVSLSNCIVTLITSSSQYISSCLCIKYGSFKFVAIVLYDLHILLQSFNFQEFDIFHSLRTRLCLYTVKAFLSLFVHFLTY